MPPRIQWDGEHPPPADVSVRIYNTPRLSHIRALGNIVGVFVHWAHQRTLPCLGRGCLHCKQTIPSKWAGYVPAELYMGKDATNHTHRWVKKLWYIPQANRDDSVLKGDIRGHIFEAVRNEQKEMVIKFLQKTATPLDDLPTLDTRAILERLWRYADQDDEGEEPQKRQRKPAALAADQPIWEGEGTEPAAEASGPEPKILPFGELVDDVLLQARARARRKGGA